MASEVTPLQLGVAAKLDAEGFKLLEAQLREEGGHCIVHAEAKQNCTDLLDSVLDHFEREEQGKFFAKFANEYLPNLMRVYLTLNSGHHCSSVYNTMVESVVDLPQFSRWIRESREGQKLAFTLIPLLALIPIAERGGEGWSPEKDLALQCRVFYQMSKVLYWSICCSPPDLTISFASPAVQRDATRLLDRFSLHYDTIKVVIKHCPESAKEYDLSEDMDFFAKRMAPFLLGSNKAGWVSGSNTISFWDCSGKQSKTPCVEVGERKDFLRCTRCLSVIYCSKAHQKWDWKHGGHKAICLVPTW